MYVRAAPQGRHAAVAQATTAVQAAGPVAVAQATAVVQAAGQAAAQVSAVAVHVAVVAAAHVAVDAADKLGIILEKDID